MKDRAAYIKLGVENGITDLNTIRSIYNKYAEGGDLESSKPKNVTLLDRIKLGLAELDEEVLGTLVEGIRRTHHNPALEVKSLTSTPGETLYSQRSYKGGTAQRTYLLPRWEQEEIFKRDGYIKGKEGDYGLVKKAVGDRDIPIWQTAPDVIDRDKLVPIGNGTNNSFGFPQLNAQLIHAGNFPSAYYVDTDMKNVYVKSWDLNDYGGGTGASSAYQGLSRVGADLLDAIGSPVVVTTGFQNAVTNDGNYTPITVEDVVNQKGNYPSNVSYPKGIRELYNLENMLDEAMNKKGLVRTNLGTLTNPDWKYTLPEVTITGKRKRKRGK